MPLDSALDGFVENCQDKPQPCWYGIVPGVTTLTETRAVLEKRGYSPSSDGSGTLVYWQAGHLCSRIWLGYQDDLIVRLGMPICEDVRLGSLMRLLGRVYSVTPSGVTLDSGQVAVGLMSGAGSACITLNPFSRAAQLWLSAESVVKRADNPTAWRGFLSFQRYQRLYNLGCVPIRVYAGD